MKLTWRHYGPLLAQYLRPLLGKTAVLLVLLLAGIALQLLNPQLVRSFLDAAQAGRNLAALVHIAWIFLLVGVIGQLCSAVANYVAADVGWRATNRLRNDLALHCLRLDMPFHQVHTPGEMIERIDGDTSALANFFSQFLVNIVGNVLLLLGVLLLLFREDWRVGSILALITAVAAYALIRARYSAVPTMRTERESNAAMMGFIEERLGGLEDIRANGMGEYTMRGFSRVARTVFHAVSKAAMARNLIWNITLTLFLVGSISALLMGAYLYLHHAISLGTVYLIYQYNNMLRNPLDQIARQIQDVQQAVAGALRIRELLAITPAVTDGSGSTLPEGPLSVEFSGVSFAYSEGVPVLHDLALHLPAGRILGVLGRTGSGKTTMIRLLFRLYDVKAGAIRVGGVPLHEATLPELRRRIGMVTQEVQLFHASVRDNLTFFDRSIPDARILQVIDELGLREWLEALPRGLDSLLHAGGSGLSAGESQLLAFTRVFLANPGLVLLDEPSSRLDPATERLIDRAVERLLAGRTCIIIAHRLGTIRRADDVLILEDGHIREYGPRVALADDADSRFAHLLQTGMEKELA